MMQILTTFSKIWTCFKINHYEYMIISEFDNAEFDRLVLYFD